MVRVVLVRGRESHAVPSCQHWERDKEARRARAAQLSGPPPGTSPARLLRYAGSSPDSGQVLLLSGPQCPSLCGGAVALLPPPPGGSKRAASVTGLRCGGSSLSLDPVFLRVGLLLPGSPFGATRQALGSWSCRPRLGQGLLSLSRPMFVTLLLQDEKGAFNFDQDTVINPETGEQVRVASAEPQDAGRVGTGGVAAAPKPASWASPPDSELVPERGDVGQQVQHHRLQLRRVPGGERGPLSLPQPPSAGVRTAGVEGGGCPAGGGVPAERAGPRQPQTPPHTHTFLSLRIFGFEGADAEDVIYVNWLNMVRAGLLALEFYTPETASWRQVGPGGALGSRGACRGGQDQ